jgi:D-beta-D-heptose 7-phosphate kinase/D-beta-D-heptose 1-phosphate adenosyltransferase
VEASSPFADAADLAELVEADDLTAWADAHRDAGRTLVLTNGCFDLLHRGHLTSLYEAAGLGDVLLVAINSDESVRRLKGPTRPLLDETSRALLLRALRPVGAVTIFAAPSVLPTIRAVRPHVVAKGSEYSPAEVVGSDVVGEWGGRVVTLSMVPGVNTSSLLNEYRARLASGGASPQGKADR